MSESRRTPWRAAIIAAVATFAVLAGSTASFAYWTNTGSSAGLTVTAATLTTTSTGWSSSTFANETISGTSSNSLTSTSSVTITNTTSTTSSSSQTLTATFSRQSGSTQLAGATTLTVWPVASTAACTPSTAVGAGSQSGTWSAGVAISTTLAPNGSGVQVYCLRNVVADRQNAADPSGTLTFVPQVSAQLSIGNFTGGSVTASSISTQYVYPLQAITAAYWYYIMLAGTSWCLDVSGSGTTAGSLLISYACKNNSDPNQDWRFLDADGDGYEDIEPRHATNLRIAATASTTSGSAVDMRTAAATSSVQEWQPQLVSSGVYQFVNQYSGLCMSAPSVSTGVVVQTACTGGADQKFQLTKRSVVGLTGITCTSTGSGQNRSASYTWTVDYAAGPYTIKAISPNGTTTTTLVASQAGTTYAIPAPIGNPFTTTGTYTIQVLNSVGDVLGTDTFTVSQNGFIFNVYLYGTC